VVLLEIVAILDNCTTLEIVPPRHCRIFIRLLVDMELLTTRTNYSRHHGLTLVAAPAMRVDARAPIVDQIALTVFRCIAISS
jgi:hypothetical protein